MSLKGLIILALLVLASEKGLGASISSPKVNAALKSSLDSKGSANIIITLKDSTSKVLDDLKEPLRSLPHEERSSKVYAALKSHSTTSQKVVLEVLKSKLTPNDFSTKVKSLWISNQIYIRNATASIVQALVDMDQVSGVVKEPVFSIKNVLKNRNFLSPSEVRVSKGDNTILADWGIERMGVPLVWSMPNGGFNGTGLIIGNIDTGVRGSHELLREKWLGPQGGWFDPENKTAQPHDVYNHGTHTMGTLVGSDGIGIAPGARWTACKGYRDDGTAEASTFISCGEFMLCPTDTSGNNPDCSKSPHVVSNSWGYDPGENLFNPVIDAWNAAGILSSFSAGNTGEMGCTSIYSPADQNNAVAVGASGQEDELAYFSSLGPSVYGKMKPEFSAPGLNIYSASAESDTDYMTASGTSMSCPNASGVLALMKAANLNLSNDRAKAILQQTARQSVISTGGSCGGVTDAVFPNNHFGHGIIDAFAAVQIVLQQK